jgi:hypothetical protein
MGSEQDRCMWSLDWGLGNVTVYEDWCTLIVVVPIPFTDDVYASVGCIKNHVTVYSKSAGKCRSGYMETMITQDTSVVSLNAAQLSGAIWLGHDCPDYENNWKESDMYVVWDRHSTNPRPRTWHPTWVRITLNDNNWIVYHRTMLDKEFLENWVGAVLC